MIHVKTSLGCIRYPLMVPNRPYLQFITQEEHIWGKMPHRERLVLNAVLKHTPTGSELQRVMDLLNLTAIRSPATINGGIKHFEIGRYFLNGIMTM